MVPEGWMECKLGELFENKRQKGKPGLPTMSVTLNDGLVLRNSLERKMETNLPPEQHLLVGDGDIAYNMMRMWQGASGLSQGNALVSPAYVVLKPTTLVDPLFASYFFKADRTIYLFWAYSYGLTRDRLRLYFPDFSIIPVVIPPIDEQRRIAEILFTWDRATEAVGKLIENSERQRRGLMQALLCEQSFGGSGREFLLGELGTTYGGLTGKSKDDFGKGKPYVPYKNIFQNSRIDPSYLDYVLVGDDEKQSRVRYGDILVTTSSETPEEVGMTSVVLDKIDDLYLNSFCFGFRLNDFETLLPEYARYFLRSSNFRRCIYRLAQGSTRYNLAKTEFLKLKVKLPSTSKQKEIARMLSTSDRMNQDLRDQLEFLRSEKAALMQQLLNGKRRVKVDSDVDRIVEEAAAHG